MIVTDTQNNQNLKLKNYRYPPYADDQQENDERPRRGIVFYVHGFSDYNGRFAHLGKKLSDMGYDVYAMDQRGHGKSEG